MNEARPMTEQRESIAQKMDETGQLLEKLKILLEDTCASISGARNPDDKTECEIRSMEDQTNKNRSLALAALKKAEEIRNLMFGGC